MIDSMEDGPSAPEPAGPLPPAEGGFRRFWRKLGGGSLVVATLFHLGLLAIATTVVLRTIREPEKKMEFIPAGKSGGGSGGEIRKKASRVAMTLPAGAARRVFAEGAASSLSLPDPGEAFGDISALASLGGAGGLGGGGFGKGLGGGMGNGIGAGSGGGFGAGGLGQGIVFFDQKVDAGRVAYVIDYSGSMRGKREKLMRAELSRSVTALSPAMQFQLLFFSGPVWIAGDPYEVQEDGTVIVTHGGTEYRWQKGGEPGAWEPKGRRPRADWLTADSATVAEAVRHIKETPLEAGTHWVAPLEMALAMKPPPQVIFFMTDGASPATKESDLRRIANRARFYGCKINTMAMMQPEAEEPMKDLARRSGGSFTIIGPDGRVRHIPLE